MSKDLAIIACPDCGTKNRISSYSGEKVPVCAKCRTPLVSKDENEALKNFDKKLDDFMNLPDFGMRSDDPD